MPEQPTVESLNATILELRDELKELRGDPKPRKTTASKHGLERSEEDWTITPAMRADPHFMLDPKNRERIKAAAQGHRFV